MQHNTIQYTTSKDNTIYNNVRQAKATQDNTYSIRQDKTTCGNTRRYNNTIQGDVRQHKTTRQDKTIQFRQDKLMQYKAI